MFVDRAKKVTFKHCQNYSQDKRIYQTENSHMWTKPYEKTDQTNEKNQVEMMIWTWNEGDIDLNWGHDVKRVESSRLSQLKGDRKRTAFWN